MAQTEMVFRLIKDGKIVGYKSIISAYPYFLYSKDMEKWFESVASFEVQCESHIFEYLDRKRYAVCDYDSFELGIKHNDEWWFEGDILQFDTGIVELDEPYIIESIAALYFEEGHHYGICSCSLLDDAKRTGNIHEEATNGTD